MRFLITVFIVLVNSAELHAQAAPRLDSLLKLFSGNSKSLIESKHAKLIISTGKGTLKQLAAVFKDSTITEVFSECQDRYLTEGEVAMILADQIEVMPYALLTGLQNCTLQYCSENPNRIEYYFNAINVMGRSKFRANYTNWLKSKLRRKTFGKP